MNPSKINSKKIDVEESDDSFVKRDKRAKVLRAFMQAENAKRRAWLKQHAITTVLHSVQSVECIEFNHALLDWTGPTNLQAVIKKLKLKPLDILK